MTTEDFGDLGREADYCSREESSNVAYKVKN